MAEVALHCRNLRTSGSMLDAVFVAEGAYGALLIQTSKIWDHVVPHIVVEEAGGRYTSSRGRDGLRKTRPGAPGSATRDVAQRLAFTRNCRYCYLRHPQS